MARGDNRRGGGGSFRRRGGSFGRNNSFRDFDTDKYRDRRGGNRDREGGDRNRRSRGSRGDREDRGDRGDRRRRGGGRRGDRREGGDIESRLNAYWKKNNKEPRADVEIGIELDEYWKQGKLNEAKKADEKGKEGNKTETTTADKA